MTEPMDTLRRINSYYGRGEIIRIVPDDNGGVAVIEYGWVGRGQKPFQESKRFTVNGNRVRFRGVTRKIGYTVK